MYETNIIHLSLVLLGPKSPRMDIDVYLQPPEELQELRDKRQMLYIQVP